MATSHLEGVVMVSKRLKLFPRARELALTLLEALIV